MKKTTFRAIVLACTFAIPLVSILLLFFLRKSVTANTKTMIAIITIGVLAIPLTISLVQLFRNIKSKKILLECLTIVFAALWVIPFAVYLPQYREAKITQVTVMDAQNMEPGAVFFYEVSPYPGFPAMRSEWGFVPKAAADMPLDTKKYTYLFSYGYEVESVTYNMWDLIPWDPVPILDLGSGRRWAKIQYKEEFHEGKLYIYRLDKKALENIYESKYADEADLLLS